MPARALAGYDSRMDSAVLERLADLDPGEGARLAVLVAVDGSAYRGPGGLRLWVDGEPPLGMISGGCLEADLDARTWPADARGRLVHYDLRGGPEDVWGLASGCHGQIDVWLQGLPPGRPSPYRSAARWLRDGVPATVTTVLPAGDQWAEGPQGRRAGAEPRAAGPGERLFVDRREPAPLLAIFGRGADAAPLAQLARRVGFRVRQAGRTEGPESLAGPEVPDAAVVMSHHFESDRDALAALLRRGPPRYLGVLGPRERTVRLLPGPWPACLHAPVGLDIGAEEPEEVAVAVVAEILEALRGHGGAALGARSGPIHPARERERLGLAGLDGAGPGGPLGT